MTTVTYLTLAAGLTVARQIADGALDKEADAAKTIGVTIVGGVLLTAAALTAESAFGSIVQRYAALVFLTALLVHGVRLGEIATNLTKGI